MTKKKQRHETLHDQSGQHFAADNILYREKTDHQDLIILENAVFGRIMALDGIVQTIECNEFIYHEMMAHVSLLAHGHAKHTLIIGGGDGAMLREVTRHKNIEPITVVEIDVGAVSFCRQYLPNHNAGSYDDPRFKLMIDDDVNLVNQTSQTFGVIISGCTDPTGPGESLFTSTSYEGCKRCLSLGGTFTAQDGAYFSRQEETIDNHRKLSHYLGDADFCRAAVPIYYDGIMTSTWVTDNDALCHLSTEIIQARFLASGLECHYYNPIIHTAAFALLQYLQDAPVSQSS